MNEVNKEKFDRSVVADWMAFTDMSSASDRFRSCGEPGRGWVGVCPSGHDIYHAFGCEQRICPSCAGRRSRQLEQKLLPSLLEVAASRPYALKSYVFGTDINILDYMQVIPDVKVYLYDDVDDREKDDSYTEGRGLDTDLLSGLREIIKLMRGFLSDLLRSYVDDGLMYGFAIGAEFGAEAGTLHFHVLADAEYVTQEQLSADWGRVNLGHGSYVWVEVVDTAPSEVKRAVSYICKYVTKPLFRGERKEKKKETENTLRMKAWVALWGYESVMAGVAYVFKGVRRFQTYASFYDLELPDEEIEVCPICGLSLVWYTERDYMSSSVFSGELLNTFRTNKLDENQARGSPVQLELLVF